MIRVAITVISLLFIASCANVQTQTAIDADQTLAEVVNTMGISDLESITFSGNAWRIRNSFRQTLRANPPWQLRDFMTDYVRTVDLKNSASLAVAEVYAQNLFFDPPSESSNYIQNVSAQRASWRQQMELWLTPWGFLSGASANNASALPETIDGKTYTVVSWQSPESITSPGGLRYTVNGYINDNKLIERVETWVEDSFMGDLHVEMVYSDYRLMDNMLVPALIEQKMAGGGVFGVSVIDAHANPDNLAELMVAPESRGGFAFGPGGPPPTELVQKLDDGVYLIVGGYVSLVAEFEDHLMVFEAGQSEQRGQQIIDEIKKILPDKPIRYIINSHPHSDHTAGLVPFIRAGATLVSHENNVNFLSKALSAPRTLLGEEPLRPKIIGVGDTTVYNDSAMTLELHRVPNGHSDGMLVALLPEQGILFQADFTLPQPGAEANPFVVELATLVDKKGLEFKRYYAVHAAQVEQFKSDLMQAIGK